jgi:proline iminopeptidase
MRIGDTYSYRPSVWLTVRDLVRGEWRSKLRPEAMIFAGRHLLKGWTVMDRLGEITAPTLVMAGRDDFIFPPEHQRELVDGIPNACLKIIEQAGHNPHSEQPAEVMEAMSDFVPGELKAITGEDRWWRPRKAHDTRSVRHDQELPGQRHS